MLIVLPKRRILLLVPAWINANMTTGFLTALFPIAVVGLYSYWLTTLMLTWWQVYIVVAVSSHAPFRNMTVVGSRWSSLQDQISWLLTLTWMTGISYSLPTPHCYGAAIATAVFYSIYSYSKYLPMCYTGFLNTLFPPQKFLMAAVVRCDRVGFKF